MVRGCGVRHPGVSCTCWSPLCMFQPPSGVLLAIAPRFRISANRGDVDAPPMQDEGHVLDACSPGRMGG